MDELEHRKLDALADFAAGAGHEINNPLAVIIGRTQMLLRDIKHKEHRKQLETILVQTQRISEMLADLWFFARPPLPDKEQFNLRKELEKLVEEQTPLFKDANVTLNFDFQGTAKTSRTETDPVLLHTAVALLLNNARESLQQDSKRGEVTLSCSSKSDVVLGKIWTITVSDTGGGVPDTIVTGIFNPFFSGRKSGRGLGFGLPKVWRIMQVLGGSVDFIPPSKFMLTLK